MIGLALLWLSPLSLNAKNLILISVDTLRADRLSCYGYQKNRTPHFDLWASEGFLFQQAFSEYPLTLPAHATMLTGRFPVSHGIRENAGFTLKSAETTVAEVFRANGYRTAAFIGSYVLASEFGISQGFETFDQDFTTSIEDVGASTELQRSAPEVTERLLRWLRDNRNNNFFAFVHFYDPHMPRPHGYDAEVSLVDRSLGDIDAFLRQNNLLEKTDVVLTSDHGESLGDHGEAGHGFFIYDSTLHIPLIIRPAGGRGRKGVTVNEQFSLVDLMPTVLQMEGIKIPACVQGRNLAGVLSSRRVREAPLYSESFVAELQFGWSVLRSLRMGKYKYIEAPKPELYDLSRDPGETRNLYSKLGSTCQEYRAKLREFLARYPAASQSVKAGPVDAETRRKLTALGYINTGGGRSKARSIDPKDRIAAFEQYHEIMNRLSGGSFNPSVFGDLEKLKASAPEIEGISYLLGWACELSGKRQEARANYRIAVERRPDNPMARARYAGVLIGLREWDEAERQLAEILRRDPSDYRSRNNLAGLYVMTGRKAQALQEVRKITQMRPRYSAAWQNLGRLLAESGNVNEAESAFRRVIQLDPTNAAAHLQLAQVLRAEGKLEAAASEEQEARRLNPGMQPGKR